MTFRRWGFHIAVIAGAIALGPAPLLGQTASPPAHEHGRRADAAPVDGIAAQLVRLDERIAMLTADMKMFTGELKIQAMADLLEALVERQTLLGAQMRRMHEHMRGPVSMPRRHAPPPANPPIELEPDALCSPFI